MSKPLNYPEASGGGTLGLTNEQLEAHWASFKRPVEYPCVRCGQDVGVPLFEFCEACLEPYVPDEQDYDEGGWALEER